MESLNLALAVILLVLSLPVSYLIAWLARDELVQGRKWFLSLILLAGIAGIVLFILQEYASALTCLFILVVAFISYRKSFDKKWTKEAKN